ncbi:type II secretion system F family protein [Citricoccus sp. SGAir0253]|uniref:type II secretion system F family protein n=1 Tax=Citricoccus sp. SGAir0253 TaxID=2567881 RepID=UPI0010CD0B45|nr:type II secretion system F family protein [Citricoccus sp. SGAir0253]QCU77500.1 type II secretion system F family protein [Citricoccus sp. SGAir0253]
MPPVIIAAALAVGLALPLLGWALFRGATPLEQAVRTNLSRGLSAPGLNVESPQPFRSLVVKLTPPSLRARLDRQLSLVGRPASWPLERVLAAKVIAAGVGLLLGALLLRSLHGPLPLLLALALTVLGYFVPDLVLTGRGQERQQKITKALPDALDQMTIAVEAGLGFDAAVAHVAHNSQGPLSVEFVRTLQDVQVGRSRRDAYVAMAERNTSADLRQFVRAIVQAEALGVTIAAVLKTQAQEMRIRRRLRAEEAAQKIPVKILMPLMLFIMPVLFIVLLGPAVINALGVLG